VHDEAVVSTGRTDSRLKDAFGSVEGRFGGELVTPDDDGFGEARRVWNGMIDRYPAVIARCRNAGDVAAAISVARANDLPVAVRGGGHSAAGFGTCDGGVVVDLSPMRTVEVDVEARTAWVGGGATWAEVDAATQAHGLAVTGGLVTHTGVGGLTLGGGIGYLMRRLGLTCDNLIGAEVVTASGTTVDVTENTHEELLWGLRGGGGNFGVVTRFRFRLHRVGPTVLAGALLYPLAEGHEVLRFYRDWAAGLPDAMTTVVALRSAPAAPHLPKELHGAPIVAIVACWSGPLAAGERVLEPLRRFKPPLVDLVGPKPYLSQQSMFDASAPHGRQNYKRNLNLAGLPDEAIDVVVDRTRRRTSPLSMTVIFQLGGAVAGVGEDDTAYSDRGAAFNIDVNAQWLDRHDVAADKHQSWVREFHAALEPVATGGAYVNFLMGDEGEGRVRSTYGAAKYERLLALKRRYDADNLFRLNQNICP
jgi:FAD/FMN-containing dehydrogenase